METQCVIEEDLVRRLQRRMPEGSAFCVRRSQEVWAEGQGAGTGALEERFEVMLVLDDLIVEERGSDFELTVLAALAEFGRRRRGLERTRNTSGVPGDPPPA